jgi:hypothetical protein
LISQFGFRREVERVFRQGAALAVPKAKTRRAALAAEGMSVPKRHANIPGTYFVTSRTWQNRAIFKVAPPSEIFVP